MQLAERQHAHVPREDFRANESRRDGAVWRTRLPWLLWAASALLVGLGVLFYLGNRTHPAPFEPVTPVMALVFPGIGGLIVSRNRANAFGWLFCAGCLLGVAFCAEQYATYTLSTVPGALPAGRWMAWIASWVWVPALLGLRTVVFLLFPDGRLPSSRWRPVVVVVLAVVTATTVIAALTPGRMLHFTVDNPVGLNAIPSNLAAVLSYVCILGMGPVCLAGLVLRHHRSRGQERAQLRWFTAAGIVAVLLPLTGLLLSSGLLRVSQFHALAVLAVLGMPAAVVLAIVKSRLYGLGVSQINTLATRTLVAPGLVVVGLALYWVIADLLDAPPFAAAVVVAIALQPAYRAFRRAAVKFLAAARAQAALVSLGRRLGSTAAPGTILSDVVETVAAAFEADYVGLAVNDEDGVTIDREIRGRALEDMVVVPLVFQNQPVGQLALALPSSRRPLDAADRHLLEDLGGQVAVAVFGVRQTAALQRSKQDAVATLEHERLCWRDAIHDTLKPTLIGIAGIVDTAAGQLRQIDHGPPTAAVDTAVHVRQSLEYVKSYVQSLRDAVQDLDPGRKPRTVGELGLVGAVRQRIATFGVRPGAPAVFLDIIEDRTAKVPTTIEVRAYLIICQAMENIDRHAKAETCWIRLRIDDDFVHVDITDDGRAPRSGYQPGEGIRLMTRLAAYHPEDEFRIDSTAEGGTMVLARLRLGG